MREVAGDIPENSQALISSILLQVTGLHTDSIEHISGRGMNNAVTVVLVRSLRDMALTTPFTQA